MDSVNAWRNNGLAVPGDFSIRPRKSVASILGSVAATAWAWRERARQRRDLRALTPRELLDVGLSCADAEGEGRKPFWQP